MWVLRIFVILLIIVLVIGFGIYNSGVTITVNFFGKDYVDIPMIYVAFWSLVVGMLISFLLSISYYLKVQSELRAQRKENKNLMEEITTLRNFPLEDVEEGKE
jgi:uncharacterized integral membrane protein